MMDIFEELNEENFTLFAIRHYDNPQCTSTEEFYEDIRRFRYLKRLLKRYYNTGELRERLILNHLIILNNVFGVENAVRMLQYKIDDEYWPVVKTCLSEYLPSTPSVLTDRPQPGRWVYLVCLQLLPQRG